MNSQNEPFGDLLGEAAGTGTIKVPLSLNAQASASHTSRESSESQTNLKSDSEIGGNVEPMRPQRPETLSKSPERSDTQQAIVRNAPEAPDNSPQIASLSKVPKSHVQDAAPAQAQTPAINVVEREKYEQLTKAVVEKSMEKYRSDLIKVLGSLDERLGGLEKCTETLARSVGDLHKQSQENQKDSAEKLSALETTSNDIGRKLKLLQEKMELAEAQKDFEKASLKDTTPPTPPPPAAAATSEPAPSSSTTSDPPPPPPPAAAASASAPPSAVSEAPPPPPPAAAAPPPAPQTQHPQHPQQQQQQQAPPPGPPHMQQQPQQQQLPPPPPPQQYQQQPQGAPPAGPGQFQHPPPPPPPQYAAAPPQYPGGPPVMAQDPSMQQAGPPPPGQYPPVPPSPQQAMGYGAVPLGYAAPPPQHYAPPHHQPPPPGGEGGMGYSGPPPPGMGVPYTSASGAYGGPGGQVRPAQGGPPSQLDKVVRDVAKMGFPPDQVRAVVQRISNSGQTVDMNSVLDQLMR